VGGRIETLHSPHSARARFLIAPCRTAPESHTERLRHRPEELVTYACRSAIARGRRGTLNQLQLSFPRLPGIIPVALSAGVFIPPALRSLVRHRHARYRTPRCTTQGASPLRSPQPGFPPPRFIASWHAAVPCTPVPEPRAGLSLARNNSALRRNHSGVIGPGLTLSLLNRLSTRPVCLRLRYLNRFAPLRPPLRLTPVAGFPPAAPCLVTSLHSPSGLLPPSGSKRSAGLVAGKHAFRSRPLPSRSPLPLYC
jgi:hypothetical protein